MHCKDTVVSRHGSWVTTARQRLCGSHNAPYETNDRRRPQMTAREVPVCDCPEPCGCYAEGHAVGYAVGKDKAYFEALASLEGPPHAED